jgi:hypothetical protein
MYVCMSVCVSYHTVWHFSPWFWSYFRDFTQADKVSIFASQRAVWTYIKKVYYRVFQILLPPNTRSSARICPHEGNVCTSLKGLPIYLSTYMKREMGYAIFERAIYLCWRMLYLKGLSIYLSTYMKRERENLWISNISRQWRITMRKQYTVCFSWVCETIPKTNLLEMSMSGQVGGHESVGLRTPVMGGRVQPMYIAMCCVGPMTLGRCCVQPMCSEECAVEPMGCERCCVQPICTALFPMQPMLVEMCCVQPMHMLCERRTRMAVYRKHAQWQDSVGVWPVRALVGSEDIDADVRMAAAVHLHKTCQHSS